MSKLRNFEDLSSFNHSNAAKPKVAPFLKNHMFGLDDKAFTPRPTSNRSLSSQIIRTSLAKFDQHSFL